MKTLALFVPPVLLALLACAPSSETAGQKLYFDYCVGCHGRDATGGGPLAEGLDMAPADLTRISERNGGAYPTAEVMSVIDGYTRAGAGNIVMPEFGAELQAGPLVMYDSGDGVPTPTPQKLVALADYLRTIQR